MPMSSNTIQSFADLARQSGKTITEVLELGFQAAKSQLIQPVPREVRITLQRPPRVARFTGKDSFTNVYRVVDGQLEYKSLDAHYSRRHLNEWQPASHTRESLARLLDLFANPVESPLP